MKKKIVLALMAIVMTCCLAACGSSNKSGSGDKVVLRVATWREFDKEYYEEIEKRFEEKYDYIDVQLEFNVDETSYQTNIQTDITTGAVADVFDLHHTGTMQMYGDYGLIIDQTDMDYMKNYDEVPGKINTWNGKNYAYMNCYNYFGCLYNMDIFNKLGLSIPKTPEELVDVVAKLKEAGYGGIAYPGGTVGYTFANGVIISSLGTDKYDELMKGMDHGQITDINTVEGLEDALRTVEYYADNEILYTASEAVSYEPAMSLFATEKAAIFWGGTYFFGEKDIYFPNVNAAYFPVPTYANNGISYAEPGHCSCISAKSEHIEEAKLWVEFIASPEISEYYCTNAKVLSPIKGVEPKFDEAEMLMNSSTGYSLIKSNYYDNGELWSKEWDEALKGIFWKGESYKEHIDIVNTQLKKADIINKK